jgi:hypothetical protein
MLIAAVVDTALTPTVSVALPAKYNLASLSVGAATLNIQASAEVGSMLSAGSVIERM